jgi:hypothetical protein
MRRACFCNSGQLSTSLSAVECVKANLGIEREALNVLLAIRHQG